MKVPYSCLFFEARQLTARSRGRRRNAVPEPAPGGREKACHTARETCAWTGAGGHYLAKMTGLRLKTATSTGVSPHSPYSAPLTSAATSSPSSSATRAKPSSNRSSADRLAEALTGIGAQRPKFCCAPFVVLVRTICRSGAHHLLLWCWSKIKFPRSADAPLFELCGIFTFSGHRLIIHRFISTKAKQIF